MFTLKLIKHDDSYPAEFYETPTFAKERIVTDTGHVLVVISGKFDGMDDDIHISEMEEDWDECFVMNSQGVTIERIRSEGRDKKFIDQFVEAGLVAFPWGARPNLVRDDNAGSLYLIVFNDLMGKNVDSENPWMPIDPTEYGYDWDKTEKEGEKLFHYIFAPMTSIADPVPCVDPEGLEKRLIWECEQDEAVTFIRFGVE